MDFTKATSDWQARHWAEEAFEQENPQPTQPKWDRDEDEFDNQNAQMVKHSGGRVWVEARGTWDWKSKVGAQLGITIGDNAFDMSVSLAQLEKLRDEIDLVLGLAQASNVKREAFAVVNKAWTEAHNAWNEKKRAAGKDAEEAWMQAHPEPGDEEDDDYDEEEDEEED